jgi:hypothetical protein
MSDEKEKEKEGEEKEGEEDADPSSEQLNDLKKLGEEPPKLPGTDLLMVEPQVIALALKVMNSLLDPKLTETIIENLITSLHLSLENKKNKIEYLKNDKGFKGKNNAMIINSIHNDGTDQKPTEIITYSPEKSIKDESNSDKIKGDKDKEEVKIKGGRQPFFTEQECSFF